jgi:hypothetical protein
MMRVFEWLKDESRERRDSALRIADDMGISDLEATSRYAAPRRARGAQQPPSFVAMVIAEWHRLIADVSRLFARKRIHRAATASRKVKAAVTPLRTPKEKRPD